MTRYEYEKECLYLREHGVVPNMPAWSIATWGERATLLALWFVSWGVIFPAMIVGFLFLVGRLDDANVSHHVEHDRCMKQATTGYEIERCR